MQNLYETPAVSSAPTPRLRNWQTLTVALMLVGYAGYYLCRADLSVSNPLIIKEFHAQGVDKAFMGRIASIGTLAYAIGKFVSGSIADIAGGRRMFLLGMGGAIACTLLFGMGGLPFFTLAWALNRLIQSAGWVGMVKITSRWFSYSSYGAAMGLISLSYLIGDFFSRLFLGQFIHNGMGWRQVFVVSASVLGVIFIANLLLSPRVACRDQRARTLRQSRQCLWTGRRERAGRRGRAGTHRPPTCAPSSCPCCATARSGWSAPCRSVSRWCARRSATGRRSI